MWLFWFTVGFRLIGDLVYLIVLVGIVGTLVFEFLVCVLVLVCYVGFGLLGGCVWLMVFIFVWLVVICCLGCLFGLVWTCDCGYWCLVLWLGLVSLDYGWGDFGCVLWGGCGVDFVLC